jgi:hypothetical protein
VVCGARAARIIVGFCRLVGLGGLIGILGVLGAPGCSSVAHGHEGAALAASYLPLEVGAVWRYAITRDDGRRGQGVVSVDGVDYGGSKGTLLEYRIREELLDGTIWIWEGREAKRVALEQEEIDDRTGAVLDEQSYDPPLTVVDERAERLAVGAAWPEAYINTSPNAKGHPKSKRAEVKWEVESLTDQVSVPAGTFTCLRLRRAQKHHPPLISWYAKGVGLVKQQGAGPLGDQTLALVAARLP